MLNRFQHFNILLNYFMINTEDRFTSSRALAIGLVGLGGGKSGFLFTVASVGSSSSSSCRCCSCCCGDCDKQKCNYSAIVLHIGKFIAFLNLRNLH